MLIHPRNSTAKGRCQIFCELKWFILSLVESGKLPGIAWTSPKVAEGLKAEKGDEPQVTHISRETVPDNSVFLSHLEKPLPLMF